MSASPTNDQPADAIALGPAAGPPPRGRRTALVIGVAVALIAAAVAIVLALRPGESRDARAARAAIAAGRYDEAEAPLRRWLAASPDSPEAQYDLARLAIHAGRPEEAMQAINRAMELGYDRAAVMPLTGLIMARGGRAAEAEPVLRRAFLEEREPRREFARELAALSLAALKFDQAVQAIDRWQALAPDDPGPYLMRNEIASRTNARPEVLIENYEAALRRDPELGKARLGLAEQLSHVHRLEEAEHEYAAHLAGHPRDVPALLGMARVAFARGDQDAAARSFEAVLAVDPRHPEALKELAQLEFARGDLAGCRRRLEASIEVDPYDPDTHYTYSRVLRLLGDSPERSKAEEETTARLRREREQMTTIRSRLLATPNDPVLRLEAARWLLNHGHDEEGLAFATRLVTDHPDHGPAHRLLADYYARKGNDGLANYHRSLADANGGEPRKP